MSFQIGDRVRIINPNNPSFGLEGTVEGIRCKIKGICKYQVMDRKDFITYKYRWVYEHEIELIKEPQSVKVEIDKNGFRLEKNLLEMSNKGLSIRPFEANIDDTADAIKYYVEYKEEKEKGEKDNMKILEIYEDRKVNEIQKEFKKNIENIKSQDAFVNLHLMFKKQLSDMYKNEFDREIPYDMELGSDFLTKDTKEKFAIAEKSKKDKLVELDNLLIEVKAQLELATDYDTQMKILKRYNIIGKDGKINA